MLLYPLDHHVNNRLIQNRFNEIYDGLQFRLLQPRNGNQLKLWLQRPENLKSIGPDLEDLIITDAYLLISAQLTTIFDFLDLLDRIVNSRIVIANKQLQQFSILVYDILTLFRAVDLGIGVFGAGLLDYDVKLVE